MDDRWNRRLRRAGYSHRAKTGSNHGAVSQGLSLKSRYKIAGARKNSVKTLRKDELEE